jgi:DMSO/TMAO reductase YedYZ molybdopterin-dependent catalytic subunit
VPAPKPEPVAPTPEPARPRILEVDATTKDRKRLPPGQHAIPALRPMGGTPGDTSRANFRLKVHGLVEKELSLTFDELLEFQQVQQTCDVHCVTTWSLLGAIWTGVRIRDIAERAKVSKKARHVIFEAAAGYTANVRLDEALKENCLVAYAINGKPLERPHGPPVRSLVPDLYFWKSAKWLTGIRFQERDERGFWERNGYHNHADPWLEERYSSQE